MSAVAMRHVIAGVCVVTGIFLCPTSTLSAGTDSLSADREQLVHSVEQMIKGREKVAVDSVFTNLQYLGGFEAAMLPMVMKKWSIALGVSCGFCHVIGKWAEDTKQEKLIARQMAELSTRVNEELSRIKNLKSARPVINCVTCHHGQLKPALTLPDGNTSP